MSETKFTPLRQRTVLAFCAGWFAMGIVWGLCIAFWIAKFAGWLE